MTTALTRNPMGKKTNKIPDDAVLLIPEPEDDRVPPAFGIKPGYYNRKGLLELLSDNKHNADAICFIADMLETGDPEQDGFAHLLRAHHGDPAEIARIIKAARV